MLNFERNKIDPKLFARAADYVGDAITSGIPTTPGFFPNRGPIAMPVAMPGPPGGGGYKRYREMTI